MMEAKCQSCGETFIPLYEGDLVHVEREDGTPCDGIGIVVGTEVGR